MKNEEPPVTFDAEILGGVPVFAGSRLPLENVLASIDAGIDIARLRESYPWLTEDHIEAARLYVQSHARVYPARLSNVFGTGRKLRAPKGPLR